MLLQKNLIRVSFSLLWLAARVPARFKIIPAAEHARFGAFLRKTRIAQGVSQRELAARLELPQSYISKIERGARQVQALELIELCSKIGLGADAVLGAFMKDSQKGEPLNTDVRVERLPPGRKKND